MAINKKGKINLSVFIILTALIIILIFIPLTSGSWFTNITQKAPPPKWVTDSMNPMVQKVLGFGTVATDSYRGLLAAFFVWLVYLIIRLFRKLRGRDDINKKDYEEYSQKKTKWLGMIGGRLWKVPVMGILFAVIMQVPILNRVISIILLDFLTMANSYVTRALILSIWIGFGPAIIENFWKERYAFKLQKRVWDAQKASAITREQAKAITKGLKE